MACAPAEDAGAVALSAALAAPALSAPLELLGAPRATHARRELLAALLRSLQLTHGARVAPLLRALEADDAASTVDATLVRYAHTFSAFPSRFADFRPWLSSKGRAVSAIAAILAPAAAKEGGTSASDAAAFFRARAAPPFCAACAEAVPHEPAAHLVQADVCAAAAAASALHRASPVGAWSAALDALPASAAAEACCLRLALAAPAAKAGESATAAPASDDEDDVDDADWPDADGDAWLAPCGAVGAYVMRRLGLRAGDEDNEDGDESDNDGWRAAAPWLLALACGAHAPLCDAYVRALVRPRRGAGVDSRRDAAARLRCVLASGGRTARRARAALSAWGCLFASPPDAKRRRTDT
jgi:hypothetical protein